MFGVVELFITIKQETIQNHVWKLKIFSLFGSHQRNMVRYTQTKASFRPGISDQIDKVLNKLQIGVLNG